MEDVSAEPTRVSAEVGVNMANVRLCLKGLAFFLMAASTMTVPFVAFDRWSSNLLFSRMATSLDASVSTAGGRAILGSDALLCLWVCVWLAAVISALWQLIGRHGLRGMALLLLGSGALALALDVYQGGYPWGVGWLVAGAILSIAQQRGSSEVRQGGRRFAN